MAEHGTVEVAARLAGEVLEPLARRLATPADARELFVELGLGAPEELFARPALAGRLSAGTQAAVRLPDKVRALSGAIDLNNGVRIGFDVGELLRDVTAALDAVDGLAAALRDPAAAVPGVPAAELRAFADELPARVLHLLAVGYLENRHAGALGLLGLLGLVEEVPERTGSPTPARPPALRRRLRLDLLPRLLSDPLGRAAELYGWGGASLDAPALLGALRLTLARMGRLVYVTPDGPNGLPELRTRDVHVRPRLDGPGAPGVELAILIDLPGGVAHEEQLAPGLTAAVRVASAFDAGTSVVVRPPFELTVDPHVSPVSGEVAFELAKRSPRAGATLSVLGVRGGPRVEAQALRVKLATALEWNVTAGTATGRLSAELALERGKVTISLGGADGFLRSILPAGGLSLDADLGLVWTSGRGVSLRGSAGLAVDVPVDAAIGAVRVPSLHLALQPGAGALRVEASAAVSARLGPFALAVERMGMTGALTFPERGGNLHVADLALGFKPPSGIGLSLDAGPIKGGGFVRFEEGRYSGLLDLTFAGISIQAIAVLDTEVEGGGWALLMLVFGRFPPIQLGWGFTLNGLGGMVGLQHGVSVEALQSGMRTGALDSVLFPPRPVENATRILNDLRVVFPVTPGALTVGPMLELGWGTPSIVRVKLGVLIQVDDVLAAGPGGVEVSRVVLVGQLSVDVPPLGGEAPQLVRILVDVVGAYETRARQLSIDARLRDSSIALLPITGSMVVRAGFGERPSFILAVGGFHPRFQDLPAGIPPQDRVGFSMRYGILTVDLRAYVAITSNTFQTGAEVSIQAAGGGFRAHVYLGFDALFVFEPVFHFEIDFRAGASISYRGFSFASADLRGSLSGPGRWHVRGSARVSVLGIGKTISFDEAWGQAPAPQLPSVPVGERLRAAFADPANWAAQLPPGGDTLVALGDAGPVADVLAHPLGELTGMQRVVPLQLEIARFGSARPSDGNCFDVTGVRVGARDVTPRLRREHFARGHYLDLTEEQKLSTPSFEQFPAGVSVSTSAYRAPAGVAFEPEFETVYLGEERRARTRLPATLLARHARNGAAARSRLRAADKLRGDGSLVVRVTGPRYALADAERMVEATALDDRVAASFSLAEQAAGRLGAPVHVVEAFELAGRR